MNLTKQVAATKQGERQLGGSRRVKVATPLKVLFALHFAALQFFALATRRAANTHRKMQLNAASSVVARRAANSAACCPAS